MEKTKLLLGGSPCTHWSIAQTKNRETKPEGLGWELFKNYLIALEKFKPDYFLYENNKSMSPAIRAQITEELGVEPVMINSALVSAQNRQRLYWVGKRNPDGTYSRVCVEQPEDRGILLRDILETGVRWREKSYTLDANYYKTAGTYNPKKKHSYSRLMAAEPVVTTPDGKSFCATATEGKGGTLSDTLKRHRRTLVAEPVRVGTIESTAVLKDNMIIEAFDGKTHPVYEVKDGQITIKDNQYPIKLADGFYIIRKLTVQECMRLQTVPEDYSFNETVIYKQVFSGGSDFWECAESKDVIAKSAILQQDCVICTTCDLQDTEQQKNQETMFSEIKNVSLKVVKECNKPIRATVSCTISGLNDTEQPNCNQKKGRNARFVVSQQLLKDCATVTIQVLESTGEQSTLMSAEMPLHQEDTKKERIKIINLNTEKLLRICLDENLQKKTLYTILIAISQIMMKVTSTFAMQASTQDYIVSLNDVQQNCLSMDILSLKTEITKPISNSQCYKMLGNGWTVDVIAHIMSHFAGITTEPVEVLSMYDGMSCGHIALDKLEAHVAKYYATEIDKYAIKTTMANYPDTIQIGDAFQVRDDGWSLPCEDAESVLKIQKGGDLNG